MLEKLISWIEKWNWSKTILILLIIIVLIFVMAGISIFIDKALMFMLIIVEFSLLFVALDILIYKINRNVIKDDNSKDKYLYHPNLYIWGIGFLFGIGLTIIYYFITLITTLISSPPENNIALLHNLDLANINYFTVSMVTYSCRMAFLQNFFFLLLLSILLGLIAWAIVKLSQYN